MDILSIIAIPLIGDQSLFNPNIYPVLVQQTETNRSRRLNEAEITQRLQALPNWKRENQTIIYTHTFNNFIEAVNFINCLVEPAETLGHHPDIFISYNTVKISLTTHDKGGLTPLDFQLAETILKLINNLSETIERSCKIDPS